MLTRHGRKAVIASILAIVLVIMIGIPIAFYLRGFLIPNFSRVAGLSDQLKELTGIDLRLIVVSFFSAIIFSSG
jgi:ABC-2 type transport system permease protein